MTVGTATQRPVPAALRRRLAALVAVVAVADFAFGAVNIIHMTQAGLTPATIGMVLAVAGIVSTAVEAPSGAVGDLFGHRRMLVTGLVLWGSGQLLFGLTSSTWPIALGLVLWAVGMACYSGAPYALVVNALRSEGREDLVGTTVRQTQVTRWVASAVGALAVFLFVGTVDAGVVVAAAGALLVLLAGWVRLTWDESPRGGRGRVVDTMRDGLRLCVLEEYRAVAVFTALGGAAFAVVVLAWQPLAVEAGVPVPALGAVLIVFTVATAIGAATSRVGEGRYRGGLTVAVALVATCLCLAWWGPLPALLAFLVAELVLGFMMAMTGMWSHEVFPDHLRNTMLSLMGVVGGVTMAAVDLTFGVLWSAVGITTATGIAGLVLLVLTGTAGALLLRAPGADPSAGPPARQDAAPDGAGSRGGGEPR